MNYKERITQLANLKYSNEEIKRIIFREYGIKLSVQISINQADETEKSNYIDLDKLEELDYKIDICPEITDSIRFNHTPITLEEIVTKLSNKFDSKFYIGQISNVLYSILIPLKIISYNNLDNTYTYIEPKLDTDQDKILENNKKIEKIDEIIFKNLKNFEEENNSFEIVEILRILYSQHPNIKFPAKYFKNFDSKSTEKVFMDRLILFIEFIRELKILLKYIFNQNKPFTIKQLSKYRNNNIIITEKTINLNSLLEIDIEEYIELIEEKDVNSSYVSKNHLGLKNLDEKIPEIIYFINNIQFDEVTNDILIESVQNNEKVILNNNNISFISNKEGVNSLENYLRIEINKTIKKIYGDIKFSNSSFLENILYKENDDILLFDNNNEENKSHYIKTVKANQLILKRYYAFLSRITINFIEIDSILTQIDSDIIFTKDDINLFKKTFNEIINIDLVYLRIIDQHKYNETKDEIEFLYEAYDKLYTDITGNVFDTQSITIEKTLLKEKIEEPEIAEPIEKSDDFDNATDNKFQSELIKIKTNLEDNLKSLNSLINKNICNNSNKNELKRINDSIFKIIRKKELFKPLFYYNFNKISGENEIIINLSNEHYKLEYEDFIINMACTLFYTKSTMTSNTIEMFINRLLSNLTLIQ